MKKALLVIVSMMVLSAIVTGCGSGSGQSSQAASARVPEALPTAQGMQIASDLEHLYFYYDHPDESIMYGKDGIYCADLNLESATLIFQSYGSDPLCMLDDKLYCNSSIGIESISLKSHDIGAATEAGTGAASMSPYVADESGDKSGDGSGAGSSASMLYVSSHELLLGSPSADGTLDSKQLEGVSQKVLQAQTGDGVVYFSCIDDGYQICSYDMEKGTVNKIAPMMSEWSFTVVGQDVYFLAKAADEGDESQEAQGRELMRADAAGNVSSTGVSGQFGQLLFAYGDFVFFTTDFEESSGGDEADSGKSGNNGKSGESEEPRLIGRPCYYDTVTGGTTVIDRDAYEGMDIALRGVSGGYLYFDGRVVDELTGRESYNVYLDKLDGSGDLVNVDLLTKDAKTTDQVLAWNEAEAQRQQEQSERMREELEEEEKNEPYGPGKSKLYLKAEEKRSACYRLVRRDGSIEFQVLLAPGESITQTFPCGRYTLKIAQGKEWISDEEAFGPDGEYDTTGLFTFEAGGSYTIGTGTGTAIRNDSQHGFTG